MGYIYLITNKVNKKQYIGQTKCEDIETRWRYHKKMSNVSIGRHLLAAYQKYGIENFKFQIVCITFDEACNALEEYYIQKFNTLAPNGYNLKLGGRASRHHEETKKLMSESIKKIMTEERRNKMIEQSKNYHANNKVVCTDKQKKLISERQKAYWANLTDEERKKISDERKSRLRNKAISEKVLLALQKGHELNKKRIGKYDLQNNLLKTYESISDAARDVKISHSTISCVCLQKGHYKTAGGFIWKYL